MDSVIQPWKNWDQSHHNVRGGGRLRDEPKESIKDNLGEALRYIESQVGLPVIVNYSSKYSMQSL